METAAAFLAIAAVSLGGQMIGLWITKAERKHRATVLWIMALAAGTMVGEALLHALPEAGKAWGEHGLHAVGLLAAGTFGTLMLLGSLLRHRRCCASHHGAHPSAWTSLSADMVCNFADGAAIAASFAIDVRLGIVTTLAVALHELPQEAGQCAILLASGMSKRRALMWNAASTLPAVAGGLVVVALPWTGTGLERFLLPAVAGAFLHIAVMDLLPIVRRVQGISVRHSAAFVMGLAVMATLWLVE